MATSTCNKQVTIFCLPCNTDVLTICYRAKVPKNHQPWWISLPMSVGQHVSSDDPIMFIIPIMWGLFVNHVGQKGIFFYHGHKNSGSPCPLDFKMLGQMYKKHVKWSKEPSELHHCTRSRLALSKVWKIEQLLSTVQHLLKWCSFLNLIKYV